MQAIHPTLAALPETKRTILNTLKKHGSLGAEELAKHAGISPSGIRQHLLALQADGLVVHLEKRTQRGRPQHHHQLTPAAHALYPHSYAELTNELLEYIKDDDPALLEMLFKKRMQRRLEQTKLRLAPLKTFSARVQELAQILDEDGYLAEVEAFSATSQRITEHNCSIFEVALQYGQACSSELEFIRAALPEAKVERVAHMIAGTHVCAYQIECLPSKAGRNKAPKP